MKPCYGQLFANASSFHQRGQAARHAIEAARESIAAALRVEPGDIVFTSGGTEADNLAVKGALEMAASPRDHLIVSQIEHQAVLHPAQQLEKKGFRVSFAPVDSSGLVDLEFLKREITDQTALVSLMHVNNETGAVQPVEEAARLAHAKGAFFHCDAVQSFGKLELRPEQRGFDLVSLSAHKICGPKGVGALYVRKGVKLKAQTHGGHQEKNIRPGTENVAAIVGFGKAAELAGKKRGSEATRVKTLRDKLEEGMLHAVKGSAVNGDRERRIYNTLSVSFDGLDGETLLMNLDLKNIFVSTGSACTAGSVEPSHVLVAMGLAESRARSTLRFSLGRFTTEAEVDYTLRELPGIVERLRRSSTTVKPVTHGKLP